MCSQVPPFAKTNASVLLDALRGIAALLVLLNHWRSAFFVDFPQLQKHRALLGILYVISGAGHQAVIIFFVLSGYLISGTVLRSIRRSEWSWARYMTHRLVRLWLVLVPALLLGLAWDTIGIHLHEAPALYAGINSNHITPNVTRALTPAILIGNAAFLQTIFVPALGSNGALWSLANEWWYYVLFPLVACAITGVYNKLGRIACAALLCLVALFITREILFLFPVWLLGAALYLSPKPRRRFSVATLISGGALYALAFFGFSVLSHLGGRVGRLHVPDVLADNLLAIITFGFLWLLLSESAAESPESRAVRLARGTAHFSYTLYVTHLPLLIFCAAFLVHDSRWEPTSPRVAIASAVFVIILAYAWIVAYATEFRVDAVRRWVENFTTA